MICVFNDSPLLFGQIHWRVVLSTDRFNVLVGIGMFPAGQQAAPPPRREMPLISSQVCWEGQDVRERPHLSAADVQTLVASGGCVLLFLG